MRASGHAYDTPQETRDRFQHRSGADEFATAKAEAACARTSGLASTVRELTRAHRKELDSHRPTEVEDRAVLEHQALGRARGIVRRG
jgi:hypothetical protein